MRIANFYLDKIDKSITKNDSIKNVISQNLKDYTVSVHAFITRLLRILQLSSLKTSGKINFSQDSSISTTTLMSSVQSLIKR